MGNSNPKTWPVLKRLFRFLKHHLPWLAAASFLSIVLSLTRLISSIILRGATDSALNHDMGLLIHYLIIALIVLIAEIPSNFLRTYSTGRFAEFSLFDIRNKTAEYVNKLTMKSMEGHLSGDLISRVTSDTGIVQGFLQGDLVELVYQPVMFITAVIYLFIVNWKLSLLSLVIIPVTIYATIKLSKPMEKYTREQQEAVSRVNSIAQDSISGVTVTKAFNIQDIMKGKFDNAVGVSVSKGLKVSMLQALIEPAGFLMQMLPFMLTFIYGGYLVISEEITFGALLSFINVLNAVVNPVRALPRLIGSLRSSSAAAGRIFEIWDKPGEREDGKSFSIDKSKPAISFNNVSFSYDGCSPLFEDLSFTLKEGETVALVGQSGCGKTTILKLITGFYPVSGGSISIYGHDLDKWKLDSVRELLSIVSQDMYLFPESILNNIQHGRGNADMDEVIEASKAAGIHEVVMSFPEGYETVVGERGVRLSGGQKQRIGIARALLKNAPILLLDEATSALDVESEHEVQEALERLMKGRTAFVVAHRLSTIKNADRILVIENGRIAESGTHDELIQYGRLYKQLYFKQFQAEDSIELKTAAGR